MPESPERYFLPSKCMNSQMCTLINKPQEKKQALHAQLSVCTHGITVPPSTPPLPERRRSPRAHAELVSGTAVNCRTPPHDALIRPACDTEGDRYRPSRMGSPPAPLPAGQVHTVVEPFPSTRTAPGRHRPDGAPDPSVQCSGSRSVPGLLQGHQQ